IGGETPASVAGDAGRQDVVPGPRSLRRALKQLNARRRWGYWVWGIGAGVTVIPELIAAFGAGWLPFTTISKMTGHLERARAGRYRPACLGRLFDGARSAAHAVGQGQVG